MIKKFILTSILSFAAYSMVGCGGSKVGITAQSAPAVATQFISNLKSLPQGNSKQDTSTQKGLASFSTSNAMVGTFATGVASCTTSTPAVVLDADSDTIADYRKYTMNCNGVSDGTTLHNYYKGTFEVKDLDPAVKGVRGGYRYNADIPSWSYVDTSGNTKSSGYYNGFWQGIGLSDTMTKFDSSMTARVDSEFDAQGHHFKIGFDYTWNYTMTVEHPVTAYATSWTSGKYSGQGEFALNGVYIVNEAKGEVASGGATMSWKAENVEFAEQSTCTKFYKSGRIIMTDISGSVLRIEFDCNNPKAYLNNQLVDNVSW